MILTDRLHFETIFREHYNALCNYVRQYVGEDGVSEDIVQDVFVHLWKQRSKIEIKDSLINYLVTSCKNKALEYQRKKKRLNEEELDINKTLQIADTTHDEAANLLIRERIYCSIRQLPPKCGQVFTLSKVDGLTYAEIAEKMNISVKTVENHMNKAFKLLRDLLG